MQNHQLYLILDINTKFIRHLKENLASILMCIKAALGLQLSTDFHNVFTIYAIDSYDIFQLYRSGENSGFEYQEEFSKAIFQLTKIISQKGVDDVWESKFVKCLSQIICRINKENVGKNAKITFITSQYFQLCQESYHKYLQLCTYAQKNKIRLDFLEIDFQAQSELKQDVLGIEGVKLGVQLTQGIFHKVDLEKTSTKMLAELLLSSFNPGDTNGFYQPKLSDLQYKAFCSCCNKVSTSVAYACSHCLASKLFLIKKVHCEKEQNQEQCIKCKKSFHLI